MGAIAIANDNGAAVNGGPKICVTCPTKLGLKNRSGKCRSCTARHLNSDPVVIANRKAARDAYFARPGVKESYAARITKYLQTMPDAEREKRREHGRRQYREHLNQPEIRAKSSSPDARQRAGRARTDTTLAWCPPEQRDAYRALVREHHYRAAEARAIIEAEIPGTQAHARRVVRNNLDAQRIRHERQKAQAY